MAICSPNAREVCGARFSTHLEANVRDLIKAALSEHFSQFQTQCRALIVDHKFREDIICFAIVCTESFHRVVVNNVVVGGTGFLVRVPGEQFFFARPRSGASMPRTVFMIVALWSDLMKEALNIPFLLQTGQSQCRFHARERAPGFQLSSVQTRGPKLCVSAGARP